MNLYDRIEELVKENKRLKNRNKELLKVCNKSLIMYTKDGFVYTINANKEGFNFKIDGSPFIDNRYKHFKYDSLVDDLVFDSYDDAISCAKNYIDTLKEEIDEN